MGLNKPTFLSTQNPQNFTEVFFRIRSKFVIDLAAMRLCGELSYFYHRLAQIFISALSHFSIKALYN